MEISSQTISIESFSYSWLVNMKPSLEACVNIDASSDEASSFIEMDPRNPPSKRFFQRNSQEFKFDFPVSQSPLALVHADELFTNGYLTPLFADSLKMESSFSDSVSSTSNLVLPSSSSSSSMNSVGPTAQASRCSSLKRCRTLSRRMFHKYLNFLRPLCRRLQGRRHQKSGSNHEAGAGNKRGFYETSPRISVAYSADDWRKSCDYESSIYEAVLHCKRSIERT